MRGSMNAIFTTVSVFYYVERVVTNRKQVSIDFPQLKQSAEKKETSRRLNVSFFPFSQASKSDFTASIHSHMKRFLFFFFFCKICFHKKILYILEGKLRDIRKNTHHDGANNQQSSSLLAINIKLQGK